MHALALRRSPPRALLRPLSATAFLAALSVPGCQSAIEPVDERQERGCVAGMITGIVLGGLVGSAVGIVEGISPSGDPSHRAKPASTPPVETAG